MNAAPARTSVPHEGVSHSDLHLMRCKDECCTCESSAPVFLSGRVGYRRQTNEFLPHLPKCITPKTIFYFFYVHTLDIDISRSFTLTQLADEQLYQQFGN
jgi:hypothetical protein